MESGLICLFNTEKILDPVLGITVTKERFRNGDFINETWITIAQRVDISQRCDVLYKILETNLIQTYTMEEFHKLNSYIIKSITKMNEDEKFNLSWFEILQLAAICEFNKNYTNAFITEKAITLSKFYQKVIKTYDF